jgi:hypothetical protein
MKSSVRRCAALNALAAPYDFRQRSVDVSIYFQGTGTHWPSLGQLAADGFTVFTF